MAKRTITTRRLPQGQEPWKVPLHLQGLSCVLCKAPFKDGDTHGEAEFQPDGTVALVCRVQKTPAAGDPT